MMLKYGPSVPPDTPPLAMRLKVEGLIERLPGEP
jgi:hypothetical protein